ncbi:MAG TPA: c-type cytochrome [Aquabacterium sp.]|nr:c-type cytochrome [Aquabacterium sp.]
MGVNTWGAHGLGSVLTALLLALSGCGGSTPSLPSDADVLAAETLRPARPELAALYARSCVACHGVRSAAPLTGHAPSWQPRLQQGPDVLLAHTREGLRGMPAMGLCPDCRDADLRDLITFMSTPR